MENVESRKSRLELFKYNAILSTLFFLGSTFILTVQIPGFSFSKYTISQMSYFLNPTQLTFFNLLFLLKGFLDLSFVAFVYHKFSIRLNDFTKLALLVAVLSFGLIGFFPVHRYYVIHWILAVCAFVFWTVSEHVFAALTKSESFIYLTQNVIFVQIASIIFIIALRGINGIFEITYFMLVFFWLIVFINRHL